MEWESTEIQLFHSVRGCHGQVVFPFSQHYPAPLGLQRGGEGQRLLQEPRSLHSTGLWSGWWPGPVGADHWCNCIHVAFANQNADFPPARTHRAAAVGAVPGATQAGRSASGV